MARRLRYNLKLHELIGFLAIWMGATALGFGLYITLYAANSGLASRLAVIMGKSLPNGDLRGLELLVFPVFFGIGYLLIKAGEIELREVLPGKGRRR